MTIEIVAGILFTGGVLTIEAIAAKLGEAFKAMASLLIGILKAPARIAKKTISAILDALGKLSEFLSKGTDEILKMIDEVFETFKAYSKESLSHLNSQIPLLGKKEVELYKKLIAIFYKGFKNLLLEYDDVGKVLKHWKKLNVMRSLSKQDIEMMLNWRNTLVKENVPFNVAIMKQQIKVNGEIIELEYKAFAGVKNNKINGFCKNPDLGYISRQLNMTIDEMLLHYETLEKNGIMRRFYDSEHKIFYANDKDIHALYTKYGKENVQVIEQTVKTLFEPCHSCKKQFIIRQEMYRINSMTIEATKFGQNKYAINNSEFLGTLK